MNSEEWERASLQQRASVSELQRTLVELNSALKRVRETGVFAGLKFDEDSKSWTFDFVVNRRVSDNAATGIAGEDIEELQPVYLDPKSGLWRPVNNYNN